MKSSLSIVLIVVLLLNVFGYYGACLGLQFRNERLMARALDSGQFEDLQIVTLKIPMSIPYMPDQPGFERVTGKFEHKGELYRLAQHKYAKDTLTVVCIKDTEHKKIDRVLAEYAKAFTDLSGHHSSRITFNFIREYFSLVFSIHSISPGWTITFAYSDQTEILLDTFSAPISHPPELM